MTLLHTEDKHFDLLLQSTNTQDDTIIVNEMSMIEPKERRGDNETNLKCDVCEVKCGSEKQMQNHNEMYHGDDGDFTCSNCPFQGNNLDRLTAHIEAAHELMMKCHNCDEKFKTERSLMSHEEIVHESLISHCRYYKNGNCKFSTAC